jgi:hypothetical protein
MLTRRSFILGAACALAAPALAAEQSARDFVTAIYDAYKGKDAKGVALDNARAIRRYFAPALATLIIADQNDAALRNEVGVLDGDPFVDAQDWEIAGFDIAVSETAPGKASATVKFDNAGTPKVVVLDVVKINSEWRVSEITWRHDDESETLSSIFAPL